jgi:plastocyanin
MLKIRKIVCTAFMTVLSVSLTLATTNGVSHADGGTITGAVTAPLPKFKKDSVVYIENVPGNWPPTAGAQINQKGLVFIPHVLPVVVNTAVAFLNYDNVLHNVFTPDKIAEKFNLGTWPPGEIKNYTFQQIGAATLLCNVHSEMEGYVVVLQNPFFSVTDENGNYSIKDVPAGSYNLLVWNKKYKGKPKPITVKDGPSLQVDVELKK